MTIYTEKPKPVPLSDLILENPVPCRERDDIESLFEEGFHLRILNLVTVIIILAQILILLVFRDRYLDGTSRAVITYIVICALAALLVLSVSHLFSVRREEIRLLKNKGLKRDDALRIIEACENADDINTGLLSGKRIHTCYADLSVKKLIVKLSQPDNPFEDPAVFLPFKTFETDRTLPEGTARLNLRTLTVTANPKGGIV